MKLKDFKSKGLSPKRWVSDRYVRLKNTICVRITKNGLYFNTYTGKILNCDWVDVHIDKDKNLLAIVPAANEKRGYKFTNYSNGQRIHRLSKGVSFRIYEELMKENYKPGTYCIGKKLEDTKGVYFDFNRLKKAKDRG